MEHFTRRRGCADRHVGAGALARSRQLRLGARLQTAALAHPSEPDLSMCSGSSRARGRELSLAAADRTEHLAQGGRASR